MKGQGCAVSGWRRAREGTKNPIRGDARAGEGGFYPWGWDAGVRAGFPVCERDQSLKSVVFHLQRMSQPPNQPPASYEAALAELDQLVGRIESGQLPLEQLLSGYQRGAELLQYCRDKLQAVENQVKVLDEGVLKPWTQE